MKLILFILYIFLDEAFASSIAVFPFQVNRINFENKRYTSTELINLLFEKEFYIPIQLGSQNQKYFGLLSLDDHHPILSASNCEKMKLFQNNQNIIKKGYKILNSETSKLLGNGTKYFNTIDFVEVFSEEFSFFNTTLIEENKNNNSEVSELILVKDSTNPTNEEMCLSIGLGVAHRSFINPEPPQFIDDLYKKRMIKRTHFTFKFIDQYNGLLIIGQKPHEYENDSIKYDEKNYTQIYTQSLSSFFRLWAIRMKEIYFYNSTKDKVIATKNNNVINILYNFGFIIGNNQYKKLIYESYFKNLINNHICELELSDKTIFNTSTVFVNTNGSYYMFICNKEKMNKFIKDFPTLYFANVDYDYTFELTYKDLFMEIYSNYYFMILFPDNTETKSEYQKWYLGLPFMKQYQFILNTNDNTIGFYKAKNFNNEESENLTEQNKEKSKVWIYILQISIVIVLIGLGVYIGMLLNKQRKKRANELKDDDYDYIEEDKNMNKNKLIN